MTSELNVEESRIDYPKVRGLLKRVSGNIDAHQEWELVSLKEIGLWSGGGTPSKAKSEFWTNGTIPWVSPKDMKAERIFDSEDHITDAAVEGSTTRLIPAGSVLIVTRSGILSHTLPVAVTSVPVTINQDLKAITPREGVSAEYVAWAIRCFAREILKTCSKQGTTVSSIETAALHRFEIPLPPLDDQRSIVAEIEKQFSRLDEAVAGLKRGKANLKRYKAAVLKAAVEGRLVATLNEFDHVPLQNLIGRIHQGWSPKCDLNREPRPDEWAVITTTAVQPMQYVDSEGKPLPDDLEPRPSLEVKSGDFLVTRKGPRVRAGVACLVRRTRHRLMVCDTVYRFRCDESKVVPDYLEVALNAPSVVNAIDRQKAGINESGVSLTHAKLGGIAIPLPPLDDQLVIVSEVDRRLSLMREVESQIDINLARAERMRSAIISKSFSGDI